MHNLANLPNGFYIFVDNAIVTAINFPSQKSAQETVDILRKEHKDENRYFEVWRIVDGKRVA